MVVCNLPLGEDAGELGGVGVSDNDLEILMPDKVVEILDVGEADNAKA